ncbi:UNKNOWN [Stylonychia lemnae]|uniref:Cadg domain containing protein n=1 Tax=Stylonychia lemnae TaxID=5949 RepID=A0A078AA11_STYLE|nr:UNKNOWN [Stylonychia lemnae]|eukprot:CDW79029.1 UNKNOWN [Stylonychia lemnae]
MKTNPFQCFEDQFPIYVSFLTNTEFNLVNYVNPDIIAVGVTTDRTLSGSKTYQTLVIGKFLNTGYMKWLKIIKDNTAEPVSMDSTSSNTYLLVTDNEGSSLIILDSDGNIQNTLRINELSLDISLRFEAQDAVGYDSKTSSVFILYTQTTQKPAAKYSRVALLQITFNKWPSTYNTKNMFIQLYYTPNSRGHNFRIHRENRLSMSIEFDQNPDPSSTTREIAVITIDQKTAGFKNGESFFASFFPDYYDYKVKQFDAVSPSRGSGAAQNYVFILKRVSDSNKLAPQHLFLKFTESSCLTYEISDEAALFYNMQILEDNDHMIGLMQSGDSYYYYIFSFKTGIYKYQLLTEYQYKSVSMVAYSDRVIDITKVSNVRVFSVGYAEKDYSFNQTNDYQDFVKTAFIFDHTQPGKYCYSNTLQTLNGKDTFPAVKNDKIKSNGGLNVKLPHWLFVILDLFISFASSSTIVEVQNFEIYLRTQYPCNPARTLLFPQQQNIDLYFKDNLTAVLEFDTFWIDQTVCQNDYLSGLKCTINSQGVPVVLSKLTPFTQDEIDDDYQDIVTYNNTMKMLSIQTFDTEKLNKQSFTIQVKFSNSSVLLAKIKITINLEGCKLSNLQPSGPVDIYYYLGSSFKPLKINNWITPCKNFTIDIYLVFKIQGQIALLPNFMHFDKNTNIFTLYTQSQEHLQTYELVIIGQILYQEPSYHYFKIFIIEKCKLIPSKIDTPITYKIGEKKNVMILPFRQKFCLSNIIEYKLVSLNGFPPDFIKFDEMRLEIFKNNYRVNRLYQLAIVGSIDQDDVSNFVQFSVMIMFPKNVLSLIENPKNETKIDQNYYNLKAEITSIGQSGQVNVRFMPFIKYLLSNITENNSSFKLNISKYDDEQNTYTYLAQSQFNWTIIMLNSEKMMLQLDFSDEIQISYGLFVMQKEQKHENDIPTILSKCQSNAMRIPRQLKKDNMPANGKFLFGIIINICNFNVLPTGELIDYIFQFNSQDSFSFNFLDMDIFQAFKYFCKSQLIRTVFKYDGTLEFVVYTNPTSFNEGFSLFLAYLFIVVSIWFIAFNMTFQLIERKDYNNPEVISKFGSLYEDFQSNHKIQRCYYLIFLMRRTVLCLLFLFVENGYLQMAMNIFLSMITICYLIDIKPYLERKQNYLEIFNEIGILLITYFQLYFIDGMQNKDIDTDYNIGYLIISLTLICLLINTGVSLYVTFNPIFIYARARSGLSCCKPKNNQNSQDHQKQYQIDLTFDSTFDGALEIDYSKKNKKTKSKKGFPKLKKQKSKFHDKHNQKMQLKQINNFDRDFQRNEKLIKQSLAYFDMPRKSLFEENVIIGGNKKEKQQFVEEDRHVYVEFLSRQNKASENNIFSDMVLSKEKELKALQDKESNQASSIKNKAYEQQLPIVLETYDPIIQEFDDLIQQHKNFEKSKQETRLEIDGLNIKQ